MVDLSERGVRFIKDFEGAKTILPDGRYRSYLDTLAIPNVWTIYTGLTKGVGKDTIWTAEECEKRFARECSVYEDAIDRLVKVPLNINQADSLISLVFNIGPTAFANSTLLKLLNQGNYQAAAAQFARWNKAGGKVWPGLVRRRAAEASLFLEPMDEQPIEIGVEVGNEIVAVPSDAMPQRVEESGGSVTEAAKSSWTIRGAIAALLGGLTQAYDWALSGAADAGAEAVKLKTSFGPWDALFVTLKANMPLIGAAFVIAGCGIVIARRLQAAHTGKIG